MKRPYTVTCVLGHTNTHNHIHTYEATTTSKINKKQQQHSFDTIQKLWQPYSAYFDYGS